MKRNRKRLGEIFIRWYPHAIVIKVGRWSKIYPHGYRRGFGCGEKALFIRLEMNEARKLDGSRRVLSLGNTLRVAIDPFCRWD